MTAQRATSFDPNQPGSTAPRLKFVHDPGPLPHLAMTVSSDGHAQTAAGRLELASRVVQAHPRNLGK